MVIFEALSVAMNAIVANFEFVIIGVLIGMALGMLPGMGGSVTLALLIPFSLSLTPDKAFMLFGSALGATSFSGSVTAILVNTPGTASNAATLLDGYPMSQQGRAREAIGAAASSSALGAIIGLLVFLASIPVLREFALLFGSPEMFWLAVFGLAIIPAAVSGSFLKGLIAGGLGLLFAFHGINIMSGELRFSYLLTITDDGTIGLIPLIIGLFAIGEMFRLGIEEEDIIGDDAETSYSGQIWKGVLAPLKHKSIFIRSSIIGIIVGAIPGMGGSVSNLVAYTQAAQLSDGDEFGNGTVKGVIASEAANDSKDGGQLIPTFALGVPGSGSMAVMLGAVIVHGMIPGPQFIQDQLPIIMIVMLSLLISNILTSLIGISIANYLVVITNIKTTYLISAIIPLSFIAAFIVRQSFGDVVLTFLFGIMGIIFVYLNISRVPVIIALVLGSILENNLTRTIRLSDGSPLYFVGSTLSALLVVLIVITLLYPLIKPRLPSSISPARDT